MQLTDQSLSDNLDIQLGKPSVVAIAGPGADRWGFHQFPTISWLPDGRLLVTINGCPDRNDAYGKPGPAYVSGDHGTTWQPWEADDPMLRISHSVISPIGDGAYLCVPAPRALDIDRQKITLPPVAGAAVVYREVLFYRLEHCPDEVQQYMRHLPALRWEPSQRTWQRETVDWDTYQGLVRTRREDHVIARAHIDNPIVKVDDRFYYPDFHFNRRLPDGSMPKNYACWLMVSDDAGRSWQCHSLIAYDLTGRTMMGEPSLVVTSTGQFACVIRCAHHQQAPMLITFSSDRGNTWDNPRPLHPFGVMPQTLRLDNQVLALSFGRPGVHLMFSPDGAARQWTEPVSLVDMTEPDRIDADSCGYTRMVPLDEDRFLVVYSYFKHRLPDGSERKAILVREVRVRRRG